MTVAVIRQRVGVAQRYQHVLFAANIQIKGIGSDVIHQATSFAVAPLIPTLKPTTLTARTLMLYTEMSRFARVPLVSARDYWPVADSGAPSAAMPPWQQHLAHRSLTGNRIVGNVIPTRVASFGADVNIFGAIYGHVA